MAALEKNKTAKSQGGAKSWAWITRGLAVSLVAACLFVASYSIFYSRVEESRVSSFENEANVGWLYQNTYLLYRALYNWENQVHVDYAQLYLEPAEGYQSLTDMSYLNAYIEDQLYEPTGARSISDGETVVSMPGEMELYELQTEMETFYSAMNQLEQDFGSLNGYCSYYVQNNKTGYYITNISEEELQESRSDSAFRVSFIFDSAGNVTVGNDLISNDVSALRQSAVQAINEIFQWERYMDVFTDYGAVKRPVDCTVTYSISKQEMMGGKEQPFHIGGFSYTNSRGSSLSGYEIWYSGTSMRTLYENAGLIQVFLLFTLFVGLLGVFLPLPESQGSYRGIWVRTMPLEALLIFGYALAAFEVEALSDLSIAVADNMPIWFQTSSQRSGFWNDGVFWLSLNLLVLTLCFFAAWYLGVCSRAVRELGGFRNYVKQRCMIYRFFPYIKKKLQEVYHYFLHIDVTKNANRTIVKVLAVNAVILFAISTLWLGGLMVTVIYSAVLYLLLRHYVSDLQKKYSILLRVVDEMADGNLNVTIDEDLGVFEPFKPQIIKIQNGFKKAVDEEVKSQHMKAELITNVSHDLKTPLTAIITYINLLKDENLTEEKRREYLDTLERKSLRLKILIEDLFEVSKANSRNITLNLMPVDIMNLIKQVSFELQDKLEEAELDVRMNLTDEKVILSLDSQKTYRIYENLFGNIAKYALRGTRVYISGFRIDDTVVITLKNISAKEITVDSVDLTERFVRGDVSRNTEGSGLGLAIAKSFTELQGGELQLEVDGDLFKATTVWHIENL